MGPLRSLNFAFISLIVAGGASSTLSTRATIGDCLQAAGVPYEAQSNSTWTSDASPFNTRLPYTPAAIVVPTTTNHIQSAVSCGAKLGLKVSPKCGGHSYASFGLGGENGHLVLELDRMNSVSVDTSTNIATVDGGARLGHVATQLFQQGGRAISHGTCPGVGISGHALHGGYGMSSRSRGLTLDWMESATIVLANASVVTCSATQNSDLFWGIRGAGSNFGVVSSFRFRTFAAPAVATAFRVSLSWPTKAQMSGGLGALRYFAENNMPPELNIRLLVGAFGSPAVPSLEGTYYGTAQGLNATLESLLASIGGKITNEATGGWLDSLVYWSNGDALDQSYPYNEHDSFYATSLTLKNLTGTSLSNFVDYWSTTANAAPSTHSWFFQLDLVGGKNAAVPAVSNSATAYAHRDKELLIQFYDKASTVDFSFMGNWVKTTTAPLAASDWGMYANYPDTHLDRATAQKLYYATNLLKLQQLKAKYDPGQLFYYPQALSPAT